MRMQPLIKFIGIILSVVCLIAGFTDSSYAQTVGVEKQITIDRIELVTQQIALLKNRLTQGERELAGLQKQNEKEINGLTLERVSKNILDKAALDVLVAKTNLDSLNIELTDTQQTIAWLEKNIQEIDNQLNVLSVFGLRAAKSEIAKPEELRTDLNYQQNLLNLETARQKYLQSLRSTANAILTFRKDNQTRIATLFKTRKLLSIKQEQAKDELEYQEQQNTWLQQLNLLNAKLVSIDPIKSRSQYSAIERDIYYANENSNYAYVQSLIARYADQIQQMKTAIVRSNSISVLNEIGDQVVTLNKQLERLNASLKARISVLDKHVAYLVPRKKNAVEFQMYLKKLSDLNEKYKTTDLELVKLSNDLTGFRQTLDHALQVELSSRQGFPTFGVKTLVDLGRELLLMPALTFHIVKSLTTSLYRGFAATSLLGWCVFALAQAALGFVIFFFRQLLIGLLNKPAAWRDSINTRWLSLQWLRRNYLDLFIIANFVGVMMFFAVPTQHYIFILYLSLVWLIFKSIINIAKLCLVETMQNSAGLDVRLYLRLKWIIVVGGVITALTVFVHLLPLIYELKALFDRLFLLLMMVVSLLLLRSWDVVPNLILSQMDTVRHPYLQRSIRIIGILIPLLMFGNSVIGVFGFLNLIMTVSWYEGLFLIVLIGYLILRGILSDAMEHLSHLMIRYVHNGWLWTEAFLKPIDKILRITLFLVGWAVLFVLYGWDKQSPIVERLTLLLNYQLVNVLNTTITPLSIIELSVVISIFYWTAKWTREFVYRMLLSRTKDLGIRNSIAILSQYSVVILGIFICLRVLGIDLKALTFVAGAFAFGVGLGLRDLANNFACGFLILLERPLRVGDIVCINSIEGEVTHIGSRAVTVRTWDHMELVVPNTEIFNKSFTNWTARDNIVRTVLHINISRYDNPHEVKVIIQKVINEHKDILQDPTPEVYLKEINDTLMDFEIRYYVNIRIVKSRTSVKSTVLMTIWDTFAAHGIMPPHPQQEIVIKGEMPSFGSLNTNV